MGVENRFFMENKINLEEFMVKQLEVTLDMKGRIVSKTKAFLPIASLILPVNMKKIIVLILELFFSFVIFAEPEIHFAEGHGDGVNGLSWSPNGTYLATASSDGTLRIWEAETGKELRVITNEPGKLQCISWSPDGNLVAAGGGKHSVGIWDVKTGKKISVLTSHGDDICNVAWSPDGKFLATSDPFEIYIWNKKTWKIETILRGGFQVIDDLTWSPDSTRLAAAVWDSVGPKVRVWNIISGKSLYTVQLETNIETIAWSPNGNYIASGGIKNPDNSVRLINANDGSTHKDIPVNDTVRSLAWDKNGDCIFIGHNSKISKCINVSNGNVMNIKTEVASYGVCGQYSPDGRFLAICFGSTYKWTQIWSSDGRHFLRNLRGYSQSINSLVPLPNGEQIIALNASGEARFLQISTGTLSKQTIIPNKIPRNTNASISPDEQYYVTSDTKIRICRLSDSKEISSFGEISKNSGYENAVWSNDGKRILTIHSSNRFILTAWDIETKKAVYTYNLTDGFEFFIDCLEFSPDRRYVAAGCHSGGYVIRVWNVDTGKKIATLFGHTYELQTLSWSHDGKYLVSGGYDSNIRIWDASDWKCMAVIKQPENIMSLAWSHDNKFIAGSDMDGRVSIWNARTTALVHSWKEHHGWVYAVVWTTDGKHIVSGCSDGTIRLWELESKKNIYTVINANNSEWISYSPEGYFTGTDWAMKNLVYVVDGLSVMGLTQIAETFYRPDLIVAKINGINIQNSNTQSLEEVLSSGEAPSVYIEPLPKSSSSREITVNFTVQNTGGGIGDVFISHNGKVIQLAKGTKKFKLDSVKTNKNDKPISYSATISLFDGENTIEAYATNEAGKIESRHSVAKISWHGSTSKPNLFILGLGINDYNAPNVSKLNFAVPDVLSIVKTFQEKSDGGMYGKVTTSSLLDDEVSKPQILKEIDRMASSIKADDVFVLYISGHGTAYNGDYYFISYDFDGKNLETAVSKDFILDCLSKISASKTVILLDTCNSGAIVGGGDSDTAFARLSQKTGQAIIAASSDTQYALEGYDGHGVFTYALLDALSGKADFVSDNQITLLELNLYVSNIVPMLTKLKWNHSQNPWYDLRKQDFPLLEK